MSKPVTYAHIAQLLAAAAPHAMAEDYDNVGLLVGEPGTEVTKILTSLDVTDAVLDEAVAMEANLVVAHHPLIFKGLKRLTGGHYVDRLVLKAIRAGIGIIACHTNLDSALKQGVSTTLAEILGLEQVRVLKPVQRRLGHLTFFAPVQDMERSIEALSAVGAGVVGEYSNCAFVAEGTGQYVPSEIANPKLGQKQELNKVAEGRVDMVYPLHREREVVNALKQVGFYEEVAYFTTVVNNSWQDFGLGAIGILPTPMAADDFRNYVADRLQITNLKWSAGAKTISKVALCGGAGSFLLSDALAQGADCYITGDMKYHEWFDAQPHMMVLDVGHYESEKHVPALLAKLVQEKLPNIAVQISIVDTNPVFYHVNGKLNSAEPGEPGSPSSHRLRD